MADRAADEQEIRDVARGYLESWLDGDGERMRGAVHPMLAKRGFDRDPAGTPSGVHHLDAPSMVASAARGPRRRFDRSCEITILDVGTDIASVKVVSEPFVDYLHLVRLHGRWSIVNALYEERQHGPS